MQREVAICPVASLLDAEVDWPHPLPPPGLYSVVLLRRPFDREPSRVLVDVARLRAAAPAEAA